MLGIAVVHAMALQAVYNSTKKRRTWEREMEILVKAANPPPSLHRDDELQGI